jgi:hypothetical protein
MGNDLDPLLSERSPHLGFLIVNDPRRDYHTARPESVSQPIVQQRANDLGKYVDHDQIVLLFVFVQRPNLYLNDIRDAIRSHIPFGSANGSLVHIHRSHCPRSLLGGSDGQHPRTRPQIEYGHPWFDHLFQGSEAKARGRMRATAERHSRI